jgi:hypothetical protein
MNDIHSAIAAEEARTESLPERSRASDHPEAVDHQRQPVRRVVRTRSTCAVAHSAAVVSRALRARCQLLACKW